MSGGLIGLLLQVVAGKADGPTSFDALFSRDVMEHTWHERNRVASRHRKGYTDSQVQSLVIITTTKKKVEQLHTSHQTLEERWQGGTRLIRTVRWGCHADHTKQRELEIFMLLFFFFFFLFLWSTRYTFTCTGYDPSRGILQGDEFNTK